METVPLAAVTFLMNVVAVLFITVCIALILLVLIQKGRGGGLSGAFGGLGAGGLFGTKTGDFLTWVTIAITVLFLSLAIIMGLFYKPTVTEPETAPAFGGPPARPVQPAENVDQSRALQPIGPPAGQTPIPATDTTTSQDSPPGGESD